MATPHFYHSIEKLSWSLLLTTGGSFPPLLIYSVARPLHKLLEASHALDWTLEAEATFQQILTEAPILSYPKADAPFILDTDHDASNYVMSAILLQCQEGQ